MARTPKAADGDKKTGWISVKQYPGLYYRESTTKKWQGHWERTYAIKVRRGNGDRVEESVGRESKGTTLEKASVLSH